MNLYDPSRTDLAPFGVQLTVATSTLALALEPGDPAGRLGAPPLVGGVVPVDRDLVPERLGEVALPAGELRLADLELAVVRSLGLAGRR